MFQTILVPVDGSKRAEQAIPLAVRIAQGCGGSLVLLRVLPPISTFTWYTLDPTLNQGWLLDRERKQAQDYLHALAQSEMLHGVPTTTQLLEGDPAHVILETAQSFEPSLIVMCSHGERGVRRWMLGSVSRQVARHSHQPVLIIRPDTQPMDVQSKAVRVLVPLDGSEQAETALLPAAQLAQALSAPHTGALHLLCVLPYEYKEQGQALDITCEYLRGVEQFLHEDEAGKRVTLTSSVVLGLDVAQEVTEIAENGKTSGRDASIERCSFIVMATHGRSSVPRLMMGSVTERVLDTTKLPLMIIRAMKPGEETVVQPDTVAQAERDREDEERRLHSWVGLF